MKFWQEIFQTQDGSASSKRFQSIVLMAYTMLLGLIILALWIWWHDRIKDFPVLEFLGLFLGAVLALQGISWGSESGLFGKIGGYIGSMFQGTSAQTTGSSETTVSGAVSPDQGAQSESGSSVGK